MREIKFRAWDTSKKEMITEHLSWGLELNSGFNNPASSWELMQYTGLKDNNGKEIYEGDIIKYCPFTDWRYGKRCWSKPLKVIWFEPRCSFVRQKPLSGSVESIWEESGKEVIGNIYENPELLEET